MSGETPLGGPGARRGAPECAPSGRSPGPGRTRGPGRPRDSPPTGVCASVDPDGVLPHSGEDDAREPTTAPPPAPPAGWGEGGADRRIRGAADARVGEDAPGDRADSHLFASILPGPRHRGRGRSSADSRRASPESTPRLPFATRRMRSGVPAKTGGGTLSVPGGGEPGDPPRRSRTPPHTLRSSPDACVGCAGQRGVGGSLASWRCPSMSRRRPPPPWRRGVHDGRTTGGGRASRADR